MFGVAGHECSSERNVRRKTGERRLDDALKALASALRDLQGSWMIIGGIAVIARGVRRMTTDVDAVVLGDVIDAANLLRILGRHKVRPRIDNAEAFAKRNLVLLLRHVSSGVDLDVSLGWTDFEREAVAASTRAAFGAASYPMARAEDLIVFKALAARPKDVEDAAALILMHPSVDLARVRRRLEELAELAQEPALVDGLDEVIGRTRVVRRAASKTTARSKAASKKTTSARVKTAASKETASARPKTAASKARTKTGRQTRGKR